MNCINTIVILTFIQNTLQLNIPSHIIFDEQSIDNHTTFKQRLNRLQKAGSYVLESTERLYVTTTDDGHHLYVSLFKEFVDLFGRSYGDDVKEYNKRFQLFQDSLQRHALLNNKEQLNNGTARYGINKFADWTHEEFLGLLSPQKSTSSFEQVPKFSLEENHYSYQMDPPCIFYRKKADRIDWINKITRIKDQKGCGSCWAFVASEQVESYTAISGKPLIERSPQELLSCSPSLGCEGGNTCAALVWLVKTRDVLVTETQYPYEGKDTKCKYQNMTHTGASIKHVCGCRSVVGHEEFILYILSQKGPVAVNVDAVLWRDYTGGIIQHHCSNKHMNHAVQLVAYYSSDGPVPYYIARNQWGVSFGEDGFVRIKYGENVCGVAQEPSFISL